MLTGGGDAPGLNGVIRAVTIKCVQDYGYEVVGIRRGWKGLLAPEEDSVQKLTVDDVRYILDEGGTVAPGTIWQFPSSSTLRSPSRSPTLRSRSQGGARPCGLEAADELGEVSGLIARAHDDVPPAVRLASSGSVYHEWVSDVAHNFCHAPSAPLLSQTLLTLLETF